MSAALEIDWSGFNYAADLCIQHSEKTYPEFANGQGLAVASRARKATLKANRNKVAVELGQIATQRNVSKKGKVSFKRIYRTDQSSLAHILVNALRKKKGEPLIWGAELDAAASQLRAKRLRAIGFISSGWLPAIKKLAGLVGYKNTDSSGPKTFPQGPGYAAPATRVLSGEVTCEIGNMALPSMSEFGHASNPMPIAEAGLQQAINETEKDMLNHLVDKLQPVLDSFSA